MLLNVVVKGTTEIHSHAASLPSVPVIHRIFQCFSLPFDSPRIKTRKWDKNKTAIYEHKLYHYLSVRNEVSICVS